MLHIICTILYSLYIMVITQAFWNFSGENTLNLVYCTVQSVPWLAQNIAFAGFPLNQLMFEWYSEVETRSLLISRECHGHFSKFYLADWVKIENKLNFITVRVQFDENITIEHIYRTSALEFGLAMWRNWLECLLWIKLDLIQLCHTKWHRI